MNRDTYEMLNRLQSAGIAYNDALAIRRCAMTLHRWHEMECGDGRCWIERDEETGKPFMYIDGRYLDPKPRRYAIADRETGAVKRLNAIMARYPGMSAYLQGDCRGAAVYVLRPGDVPEGGNADSYYSRGIAVFK